MFVSKSSQIKMETTIFRQDITVNSIFLVSSAKKKKENAENINNILIIPIK